MKLIPKLMCLVLFAFSGMYTHAQNRYLDSLASLIAKDKEDTSKVVHYSKLIADLRNADPARAVELSQPALALANSLKFEKGIAEINTWTGSALHNLGKKEEALSCFSVALQSCAKIGYKLQEARATMGTAMVYDTYGDNNKALPLYHMVLKILEEIGGDKKFISSVLNSIGSIHNRQGNYPDANNYLMRSLKVAVDINDKRMMAAAYNNLGTLYENQKLFQEALDNYSKAIAINTESGNKNWLANNYANSGVIYYNLAIEPGWRAKMKDQSGSTEDYLKMALTNYSGALKIKEEMNDINTIASIQNNIGLVEWHYGREALKKHDNNTARKKFSEALDIYKKVLKTRLETEDKDGLCRAYGNIAGVSLDLKLYEEAKLNYARSMDVAREIGNRSQIQAVYAGLCNMDSVRGNYKSALYNYRMYTLYKDSLLNDENTRKAVEARLNFEFEMKQAADSLENLQAAAREKLLHEQEISQQKTYTYGGLLGFLLMIVVAGISFKAYRQKQKDSLLIYEQKVSLEQKQKEVKDSMEYAQRIQKSLLPNEKYLTRKLAQLKDMPQTGNQA